MDRGEESRKVREGRRPPSPELERQTGQQRHRQSKQGTEGSGERARPGMGSSQKREERQGSFERQREERETETEISRDTPRKGWANSKEKQVGQSQREAQETHEMEIPRRRDISRR